jgi:hypothetical protein
MIAGRIQGSFRRRILCGRSLHCWNIYGRTVRGVGLGVSGFPLMSKLLVSKAGMGCHYGFRTREREMGINVMQFARRVTHSLIISVTVMLPKYQKTSNVLTCLLPLAESSTYSNSYLTSGLIASWTTCSIRGSCTWQHIKSGPYATDCKTHGRGICEETIQKIEPDVVKA